MKACRICFVLFFILLCTVGCSPTPAARELLPESEYLRIHVRADGNSAEAQRVKYLVKDAVVAYLTPLLSPCVTKEEARQTVLNSREALISVANAVLSRENAPYRAAAALKTEVFPTRVYDGITLPFGSYEALVVTLGKGTGENWWCVVYPPLCFTGAEGEGTAQKVEYRSFLWEQIQKLID